MRVLVTHPGIQHAYQLAWALEEAGHLAAFWSGVPISDSRSPGKELWSMVRPATREAPVSSGLRKHPFAFPVLRRLATALLSPFDASCWTHRLDHQFDRWAAKRITKVRPDMVVCYENAALQTFRAARTVGAVCVLDAAGIHYTAARAWGGTAVRPNPKWIDVHKQQEIDLADSILTCSELAGQTYVAAGLPADRVRPIPLGTDVGNASTQAHSIDRPCHFVFAGSIRRLKGVDMLLDVFEDFKNENVPARLSLVGDPGDADLAKRADRLSNVSRLPFIPQARLFGEMQRHDCLVLPSRFDSFGMVVAEAMAMGVPALVTDQVGAKCIIEQHPNSGWIVGCAASELKARMLWLIENRTELARASAAARVAAQDYSWARYRDRVVPALLEIQQRHAAATGP